MLIPLVHHAVFFLFLKKGYSNHPCASAVSHARRGDGLGPSLLSLLLELLRPAVEEGRTLQVNTGSVLSEGF